MRAEYALARAAPEIGKYEARLPGGILVEWEDSDCGFALSGAPNWCRDLVLCKWAGSPYTLTIPIGAGNVAAREVKPGPWGIMIAHAASREIIASKQCPACEGRGSVIDGDLVEDCRRCEGTGATTWGNQQRADMLEISETEFRRGYHKFHRECLRALIRGELETLSSMAYRLSR